MIEKQKNTSLHEYQKTVVIFVPFDKFYYCNFSFVSQPKAAVSPFSFLVETTTGGVGGCYEGYTCIWKVYKMYLVVNVECFEQITFWDIHYSIKCEKRWGKGICEAERG